MYTRLQSGRMMQLIAIGVAFATSVEAHEGRPHSWSELASAWSFEPVVVVSLLITAILFVAGLRRRTVRGHKLDRLEAWSFVGGWLALAIALVSPLHAWGSVLFSAHMGQHEVLMLVAAPLLVLARPLVMFTWAVPLKWFRLITAPTKSSVFRKTWRFVTLPLVAFLLHAVALWVWHFPSLFDAVQHSELVHSAQHMCFLFSALLFWWSLIRGQQGVMGYGSAVLYLFTTSLHSGLLGALLSLSDSVWYSSYVGLTKPWGLTPIEDQQLGGLIMWIPAGFVYLFAALLMFVGWMQTAELRAQKFMKTHDVLSEADS